MAVAALLAPLSVLATWASGQIEDTDRYVATVGPLANDPDVQKAIAARAEQVIFSYLDLDTAIDDLAQALSDQGVPPRVAATLQTVSGPLAYAIRSFVSDRILAFVQSDAFEQAWIEANRTAHSELVTALTGGGGGAVTVNKGAVQVNLAVVINTIKQQLSDAGFAIADRIPEVSASFTIVQSDNLDTVQTLLGVLDNLAAWLPVLGLGLLAVAVLLARDRRRMVLASGIAVAASMLLLGATLNVIRPFYLNALPESASAAAAGAIYDQLVYFIRLALRGLLVVALTVAVVAWLSARTRLRRRGQGRARPRHRHRARPDVPRGAADRQARRRARAVPRLRSASGSSPSQHWPTWPRTTRPEGPPWCSSSSQDCWCSCWSSWRRLHNRRPRHPGRSPSPEQASAKDSTTKERDPARRDRVDRVALPDTVRCRPGRAAPQDPASSRTPSSCTTPPASSGCRTPRSRRCDTFGTTRRGRPAAERSGAASSGCWC